MTDIPDRNGDKGYEPPDIVAVGTFAELTQGSAGTVADVAALGTTLGS